MRRTVLTRRQFVRAGVGVAAAGAACQALFGASKDSSSVEVHTWEKYELALVSDRTFSNPYTDATVWVDLTGPGFQKRVFGFWDGGNVLQGSSRGYGPGNLALAKRLGTARSWACRQNGIFRRQGVVGRAEAGKPVAARISASNAEPPRTANCRRHTVFCCRRYVVCSRDKPLQVVRRRC